VLRGGKIRPADINAHQIRPMAIRRTCFRRFWTLLEAKLTDLRATSASSISILDAGCGPGTWLRRLVTRAHVLEAELTASALEGGCPGRWRRLW
jgi:hypothetical protein